MKWDAKKRKKAQKIVFCSFLIVFLSYILLPRFEYSEQRALLLLKAHSLSFNRLAEYMIEESPQYRFIDGAKSDAHLYSGIYKAADFLPTDVWWAMRDYFMVTARACSGHVYAYREKEFYERTKEIPEGSAIVQFLIYAGEGSFDEELGNHVQVYQTIIFAENFGKAQLAEILAVEEGTLIHLTENWYLWNH